MHALSMILVFPEPRSVGDKLNLAFAWLICAPLSLVLIGAAFCFLTQYRSANKRLKVLRSQIGEMGEAEQITGTVKELRQGAEGQLLALVQFSHAELPDEMLLTAVHQPPAPGMPFPVHVIHTSTKTLIMTEQDMTAACLNIDMETDAVQRKAERYRTLGALFAILALPTLIFTLDYFFSVLS